MGMLGVRGALGLDVHNQGPHPPPVLLIRPRSRELPLSNQSTQQDEPKMTDFSVLSSASPAHVATHTSARESLFGTSPPTPREGNAHDHSENPAGHWEHSPPRESDPDVPFRPRRLT